MSEHKSQQTAAGLSFRHVSKEFLVKGKPVTVLEDINLTIESQSLVTVLGESGCGKTTLLHIAAGLESYTSGDVTLNGELVRKPSSSRCMVFQKPALLPWINVADNIALGPDMRRDKSVRSERLARYVRLVGLEGFEEYLPCDLSGGMAQRAALARALINQPEVLLLDEPFSALDAITRTRLQDELLQIWTAEGCTVVFVTHDIDEAIYLGTKIVVMAPQPGRICGVFDVPLSRPRVRGTREFRSFRAEISNFFFEQRGYRPALV